MKVVLLQYTSEPERIISQAARLCYSASGIEEIAEKLESEKIESFIKRLIKLKHFSAFEHVAFTFGIEGVSRALTHQLVRHRLASFSQQSQRYVAMRDFPYILPPSLQADSGLKQKFELAIKQIGNIYGDLLDAGIPAEDARYLLPNACETKIVVTMNARELMHFFSLRCCNRAQWEIHDMADEMLRLTKKVVPILFEDIGPGCVKGPCPEETMTCGKLQSVREKYKKIV